MTITSAALPQEETRRNSVIRREVRDGVPVYVKQSRSQDWEASAQQVRERCGHEADVLRRLAASGRFHGRLGMTPLVESQPEEAIIVTREAPGCPLQEYLLTSFRRDPNNDCMRALLLAGRWLSAFQQVSICTQDVAPLSELSPHDLVEYCAIRLGKLNALGYRGLNPNAQRRLLDRMQDAVDHAEPHDRQHVMCHGDYGAFNLLWDGRVLTGIDFTQSQTGVPLLDVTYFLHRVQMLPIYFPWKRWPVAFWERAFLRGYGRPAAVRSPLYRALMIRHLLCRLQTYVRRPRRGLRDKLHTPWVIDRVRRRLLREVHADPVQDRAETAEALWPD